MSAPNLTIVTNTAGRLAKRWRLDESGKPVKESAGPMTKGEATPARASTPPELAALIAGLQSNQALCFGVSKAGEPAPIVRASELGTAPAGSIARTRDCFRWPDGPGWMMLDHDPAPGGDPLSRDELRSAIYTAAPSLKAAPMLWAPSSSSCIEHAGEAVTGIAGQRLYIAVADADDIPRAGKVLFDRLFLAGYGRFDLSKSGSLLERTLVDGAVWQPERLDFAAAPIVEPPLTRSAPAPAAINGQAPPIDTRQALPDLAPGELEELKRIKAELRGEPELLAEQAAIREGWIDSHVEALPADQQTDARERFRAAVEDGRLFGDFELIHQSGQRVSVGELLDNADRWHNERFYDPLEPSHDRRIAWLNLRSGGRPFLYSHKHGGRRFTLHRATVLHRLAAGAKHETVSAILERLRLDGEVFERAGRLVRLAGGEFIEVTAPWLQNHAEQIFRFERFDSRTGQWRPCDCPADVAQRLIAARGSWRLPQMSGLVTFPPMRPDGTIIERPGFDEKTGLLYLAHRPDPIRPRPLDAAALHEALTFAWRPFSLFPFDGDLSRACWMAALLTTVCRPALPTAPAFLIRAYAPGTGKSLLSECAMLLAGAPMAALPLSDASKEEQEKRIAAKMLTGAAGMVFDNLSTHFDSDSLCAMLTSAEPEVRVLGASRIERIQNRALTVLNGNNVSATGDLFRRVLPVTLDANCERPELRVFKENPREFLRANLDEYRAALLSILATFVHAGMPQHGTGSLGSFDEWDRLVRQCVCWLIHEGLAPVPMADPVEALELSKAEDPAHQAHAELMAAWFERFGAVGVRVKDLAEVIDSAGSEWNSTPADKALAELLTSIGSPPRNNGRFCSRYFGVYLRKLRGRVNGGLRIVAASESRQHGNRWRVEPVS